MRADSGNHVSAWAPPNTQVSGSQSHATFKLFSLQDLINMPPPSYLVDNLLPENGLATLIGAPGCGKSFMALDIALCVAHGIPWQGLGCKQGTVIYLAGEGVGGMPKRIQAWLKHHDLAENSNFHLIPDSVGLLDADGDVAKLTRTLEPISPVALVITDTMARSFIGGDENSAADMGRFITSCSRIQKTAKGAMLVTHHTGKAVGRGARGSTALLGAVDTELKMKIPTNGRGVTLSVTKQKDDKEAPSIHLKLTEVVLSEPDANEAVTSCILERSKVSGITASKELNVEQKTLLEVLKDAGPDGLSTGYWYRAGLDVGIATKRRAKYNDIRDKLVEAGLVSKIDGKWIATSKAT